MGKNQQFNQLGDFPMAQLQGEATLNAILLINRKFQNLYNRQTLVKISYILLVIAFATIVRILEFISHYQRHYLCL